MQGMGALTKPLLSMTSSFLSVFDSIPPSQNAAPVHEFAYLYKTHHIHHTPLLHPPSSSPSSVALPIPMNHIQSPTCSLLAPKLRNSSCPHKIPFQFGRVPDGGGVVCWYNWSHFPISAAMDHIGFDDCAVNTKASERIRKRRQGRQPRHFPGSQIGYFPPDHLRKQSTRRANTPGPRARP
ncbi:uncharacterized protein J3D65DRAFT_607228 [Phyllosticta citribraziliensis]|uniref:Uncharacterized protein n=1 Tax=Phyllosticta citribraziliensis TaxID=989973 RepID=A0ABR1L4I8_9PEZI